MAETANQIFLPWVQPPIAAYLPEPAIDRLNAAQPAFVSLPVKLVVNAETLAKTVRLVGPGQVTGFDPQQVVRVEPRPYTTDFEPNYFPCLEFDRPDFPWLFTPAKGDGQGRLRPWLCLVVVRKQPGVDLRPMGERPQPVLVIKAPAQPRVELPDLSESHLWAHAQLTGVEKSQMQRAIATQPKASISRLLCPRRLDAATDYIACVVPTFEVGRRAGLNLPILPADEQQLQPAWASGPQAPAEITLPVYYCWEFRTGDRDGDFEALVRRLEPRQLPPTVGKRPMDISRPGFAIAPAPPPGTTLGLEGALRVVDQTADEWPEAVRLPFQTALASLLNRPWELASQTSAAQDPLVAPPIYGSWPAARHTVSLSSAPAPTPWLDELNLDPRYRSAAALGTRIVQTQQEALMSAAWEQLGDIQQVNQRLRQAQLSRAVNTVYYQSFSRFSAETLLKIVAPAQAQLLVESRGANQLPNGSGATMRLAQQLTASVGSTSVVSAPLRRLARPRGPINRPLTQAGGRQIGFTPAAIAAVNQPLTQGIVRQPNGAGEITWMDDNTPAGATLAADGGDTWQWVATTPTPFSGARIHHSKPVVGLRQHYFDNATDTLEISPGDRLFAYIWIDLTSTPSQIMLQWHSDMGWNHRAYWRAIGPDATGWGVEGTDNRRRMAGFPVVGGWARLEVPAQAVGLVGKTVDGMAFTLVDGAASWGRAGKIVSLSRGAVTIDTVSDRLPNHGGYQWVEGANPHWERVRASDVQMHDLFRLAALTDLGGRSPTSATSAEFYAAARAHQTYLQHAFTVPQARSHHVAAIAPTDVQRSALDSLNPELTIPRAVFTHFTAATTTAMTAASGQPVGDPLDPIMDAPSFPQAMAKALGDLSQAYLFAGLEQVPPNTVQLLQTNPKFIEAFMVGLNLEMGRELLWRGYPSDQRGTYFRRFWDTPLPNAPADISPIHQWGDRALGENSLAASRSKLVLLIRSELLRRYPNTVIYAVKAVANGADKGLSTDPAQTAQPLFRGTLEPDVTFIGFDLTPAEMLANLGWYIVLQQQPSEPRFGLDMASFTTDGAADIPALATWDDLSWAHLAPDAAALEQLSHVAVGAVQLQPAVAKGLWGRNAAHMAYITKQRPVRVAVHASELIRPMG
ncbi:hypothetical protein [Nodosilinea nodulosa]|uniref:hypothetical protein n=1 Tax=Nodosilinea nodulosa TaxID=416001 RepID=UPI000315788A|nr:hypothetical protein [Nodosilinea nodulosa]